MLNFISYSHNKLVFNYELYVGEQLQIDFQTNYNDELYNINKGCLTISNPDSLLFPYIKISLKNKETLVGIRTWLIGKYQLVKLYSVKERPLYCDESIYVYWKKGFLYKRVKGEKIKLCSYSLDDMMYSDMEIYHNVVALRSGGTLKISSDLLHWKQIYQGKRGIKNSMCFYGTEEDLSLIFIEYTPGKERVRHKILRYSFGNDKLEVLFEFYTEDEFLKKNLSPCARHIHVIMKDPYTDDLYVGTGDTDLESGIYRSTDGGKTFQILFSGKQNYRALNFIFTQNAIFWNTDTHESQALFRLFRKDLKIKKVTRFPLINGALWCSIKYPVKIDGDEFYIMSSNSEGALFDNYNRVYGIKIRDDVPTFYELLRRRSRTCYSQQFILGLNDRKEIFLYDHEIGKMNAYRLSGKEL